MIPDGKINKVINNRPIGLLCSGVSIEELRERVHKPQYDNICWVGINSVGEMSKIIEPRRQDIFCVMNVARYKMQREFINRNCDTLLIAKMENGINPEQDERFKKLEAHTAIYFTYILNVLGHKEIYLFGADGFGMYHGLLQRNSKEQLEDMYQLDEEFIKDNSLSCINVNNGSRYSLPEISYDEFERGR